MSTRRTVHSAEQKHLADTDAVSFEKYSTRRARRHPNTLPHLRRDKCEATGKLIHKTPEQALEFAQMVGRSRRRESLRSESMYSYECEHCGGLHLTRARRYRGRPSGEALIRSQADAVKELERLLRERA